MCSCVFWVLMSNRFYYIQVACDRDLDKIKVEERRREGNHERETNKLWRLLYQNHLSLKGSLLVDRKKLTLFGRSVIATPSPSSTPQAKDKSCQSSPKRKCEHTAEGRQWQNESVQLQASEAENAVRLRGKAKDTMRHLLDCMPGNDGTPPVNDIQLSTRQRIPITPSRKVSIKELLQYKT